AMATVTLMAMDQLAGAAARPAEGEPGSQSHPILVKDSATLGKIGQPGYPPDAHYLQTQSFSHNTGVPVGNGTRPFQGHYDGGCHTIRDLKNCTFGELGFGAKVENLRIAYATIEQSDLAYATIDQPDQHSAVLACKMSGESAISHVRVEHGIVSTRLSGTVHDPATTGVITGLLGKGSNLTDIDIVNCSVTTSGQHTYTGVGAGWVEGNIERMTVAGTNVTSAVAQYPVAIGGGQVTGEIKQLTVNNCRVTVAENGGNAAIGGGEVGRYDSLGIFFGKVSELVALNSHVSNKQFAAIGAGNVVNNGSEINGITAINCSVSAKFYAAIGAGLSMGQVTDITAVNCKVKGLNEDIGVGSRFGTGDVSGTASLNSRVNGKLTNIGRVNLRGLCSTADARIVNDDCHLMPDSFFEDHWNCSTTATTSAPARSPATSLNSSLPQPTAAFVNKTGMADTTAQQPVMTPLNTTTMANTDDQLSSQFLTTSASFNKTAMANTVSPLSSEALSSLAPSDKTATANTTSPLTSQAPTSSASLDKTA
ncbi:hypothetical protein, partial [Endozoicomonas sp. ONNA2]|uniref:hypothetical protein n=1 Tax=Endozoicomonas sp. ONNA2 TaxID=2828741 RepID=UPI0021486E0C